jgi:hypothetical protein
MRAPLLGLTAVALVLLFALHANPVVGNDGRVSVEGTLDVHSSLDARAIIEPAATADVPAAEASASFPHPASSLSAAMTTLSRPGNVEFLIVQESYLEDDATLRFNAFQIFRDYKNNELRADKKYKGKTFEVEGIVKSVEKNAFGGSILYMYGSSDPFTREVDLLMLTFREGESEWTLINLNPGNFTIPYCTGAGMTMGVPVLKDCGWAG